MESSYNGRAIGPDQALVNTAVLQLIPISLSAIPIAACEAGRLIHFLCVKGCLPFCFHLPVKLFGVLCMFTENKQVGSRQTVGCFVFLRVMRLLLGFRLEPPVEPRREKSTLGAQAWQRHQTKKPPKQQICGNIKPSETFLILKST